MSPGAKSHQNYKNSMGPTLNYRQQMIKVKHDRNLESIKTKAQANGSNKKKRRKKRYTRTSSGKLILWRL